jgi:hypothetical protein
LLWRQRQHAAAAMFFLWQPSGTMHPEAVHCIGACVQQRTSVKCSDINIFLTYIHTRYTHSYNNMVQQLYSILYSTLCKAQYSCIHSYHQRSIHHFMKYAVLLACLFVSSSKPKKLVLGYSVHEVGSSKNNCKRMIMVTSRNAATYLVFCCSLYMYVCM